MEKPWKYYFMKKRLKRDIKELEEHLKEVQDYRERLLKLNGNSYEQLLKRIDVILKLDEKINAM